MKPHPVGDLKWVKASHRSPYGLISSEWKRDGDKFDWRIEIPANATATVYLPVKSGSRITESGQPLEKISGGLEFGSGKYHFVSE